ncbi:MAG: DUF5117 domain-containing protein, partial [Ferruginibacter sp.]
MRLTQSMFVAAFALFANVTEAQRPTGSTTVTPPTAPTTGAPAPKPLSGPKPYSEVITSKAKTDKGLLITHQVDEKYYFEIPDAILGREILVINRISKAAAAADLGRGGYAGDQIGENVIAFEKGPNNKIFVKVISHQEKSVDSTGGMYQSVRNSSLQPIASSFPVAAYAKDSVSGAKGSVIEVTDFLMGDNDILFFDARYKRSLGLNAYQKDNSYIEKIKSYPSNTQVKTVKTYLRSAAAIPGLPAAPSAGSPTT